MARTFTGLKLQGEIGRFGKTELSDIEGYVELPDGKVLSGCESGKFRKSQFCEYSSTYQLSCKIKNMNDYSLVTASNILTLIKSMHLL